MILDDKKVLVACNTLTSINGDIYQNHASFYYRLGKDHPDYTFHMLFSRRLSIDRFRNSAVKTANELGCRWLLFIDDDMKLPRETFLKLMQGIETGYGIVGAFNYIRGYPYQLMVFKYREDTRHLVNIKEEDILPQIEAGDLIDCDAIGTAVCIIDMKVVNNTGAPWFVTGPYSTEDIYFCLKATDANPGLRIGTHCGIQTGHMLEPELINYKTRPHLKAYEESYMTGYEMDTQTTGDRGAGYIKDVVEPMLGALAEIHAKVP